MDSLQSRLASALTGRYSLDRELGQGGMAVVFLANDLRHDRQVALKVLRPEVSAEIGAERFLREIKMAAGLTHPHILPVFDSGEAGGLLFYVMPSMEGRSLRERLDKERQLSLSDALRLTREVASALDYAHRHNVVHRDIKPENILLHEGAAMVADFGIGKALTTDGRSITQTGLAIGTPAYMSPEQSAGELGTDGRSDLYSLGCVLYEMLTGEPPFTGVTPQAIIAKRFVSPIPKVRTTRDVPEAVDVAVSKALARTPVDRYPTAADFAEALRQIGRDGGTGPHHTADSARAAATAIAVLPFKNMSADPENEYFSDGMTEEIINALGKVPGIHVASRTSCFAFKGKDVDIRQIGEKLGATSVLEGSVRKVGNKIRITAQLSNVESGYHLWNETYDRQLEDVFAVQDEISRAIVDALKLRFAGDAGQAQVVAPTKNLEAYTLYLKGRFFFAKLSEPALRRSLDLYQQALLLDPALARAYAGIADAWCNLADDWVAPDDAYPRAKGAAERALQREPNLAEAITSLGKVLGWHEWKFEEAEVQLARAVSLAPNYAEACYVHGTMLPAVGRLRDGIDTMRKALVLDPLSVHYSEWLSRFLLYDKDYAAAIMQGERTIDMDEICHRAQHYIGSAHLAQGDAELALSWHRRAQSLERAPRSYDAMIVRALAALGQKDEAEAILTRLEDESKKQYLRGEVIAMGYAAVGNLDGAFASLERAYQDRSAGLMFLHLDPGYEGLRKDARYADLVKRIGVK
jgi:serine/threonine protein kinase/tetratricopeptide (TPR) repeat protein